jgi:choline dehydrogenase-like flavoprotein
MVHDRVVKEVLFDKQSARASGVRTVDRNSLQVHEYSARLIFLCASTLGTTQIMLNSKSETFPKGIANSSGVLGHYLMDHHMRIGASGNFPGFSDDYYSGRRPNGVYIPRFRNLEKKTEKFLRGYAFQGSAYRPNWQQGLGAAGFGRSFKQKLQQPGNWRFQLLGFGEMLPRYENHVQLDAHKRDRWGMPLLSIDAGWGNNEYSMREDIERSAVAMLEAAGITDIESSNEEHPVGLTIHEMGTARMGRERKSSVLNAYNQCHDVPNLFVTDGAAMASSACQNPSLTYMALTARAVDYAVKEFRAGRV